jgi:hypothetical protein
MREKNSNLSTADMLGIAFVVLKLCHIINWSWWWVTAPFWGGVILLTIILIAKDE